MLKYLRFYEDRGLTVVKALGQYVWGSDGRRYLDLHTGHGVAFLGHNNHHVVRAVKEQLDEVMTLTTSFRSRALYEMLDSLSRVAPRGLDYVALQNSGAEAVELALKLARRASGKGGLVAFTGSFHGRTLGALSVTWNPRYRKPFEPLLEGVRFGRFNDVGGLDEVFKGEVSAVIVEVVQGEGGVNVASREFIRGVREAADRAGALLIIDEVQTGFGRTGAIWAYQHFGVEPDILVAGKALGGGFPVSAVFTSEEIASKLGRGEHGTTYGGNPVACAAVKAAVEVLVGEDVPGRAREAGAKFMEGLRGALKGARAVREVRGLGLMIGVDLRFLPGRVIRCAQERGVLVLKAGTTVVRLLPPYLVSDEDIERGVEVVAECVEELSRGSPVKVA